MLAPDFDPDFIERIVQEVLRRLRDRGVVGQTKAPNGSELSLDEKVIALDTLRGRLNGVQRIVVTGKAIVTPAAKDELSDRSIELVRRS